MSELFWKPIEYGGLICIIESEGYRRTARIVQGGDEKWTASVYEEKLGRKKKVGTGRIASTLIRSAYMKDRGRDKNRAIAWSESEWLKMGKLPEPPQPESGGRG